MSDRRQVLLRVDPAVHDALMRWAADEFRSLNAHVELLLRRALADAGRMPKQAAPLPARGRPRSRST
jgi:hypothetical protein